MRLAVALLAVVAAAGALAQPRPQPEEAVLDGCRRVGIADITRQLAPNWVYVGDRHTSPSGPPPESRWAAGVVDAQFQSEAAVHPAGADGPGSHFSYDLVFNLRPSPKHAYLLAGDPVRGTGNFAGREGESRRLHSEWEQDALPLWAWPEVGDRIVMRGSWVWDCDHWTPGGERTEFHPIRALWVVRELSARSPFGEAQADLFVSTDKTAAGMQADCAHRARADTPSFGACLRSEPNRQDVNGDYAFALPAPPRPSPRARLRVRVVDRGSVNAPQLRIRTGANRVSGSEPQSRAAATVRFSIAAPSGERVVVAKQVFLGWTPMPRRALPVHLRVSLRRLLVRRAMDPGCLRANCPSVETTETVQDSRRPGEWNVYWDVAGIWGMWSPRVLHARDGQSFRGQQVVDLYVPPRRRWRLAVFARECDLGSGSARGREPLRPCPATDEFSLAGNDDPGRIVRWFDVETQSRPLLDASLVGSSCPRSNRRGCFALEVDVRRVPR